MSVPFPAPEFHGKRRRWRLSGLIQYEHALAGLPPPAPTDAADERYLTSAQVRQRYQVSDMWLHRRLSRRAQEAIASGQ
jgi:hypothetical protein